MRNYQISDDVLTYEVDHRFLLDDSFHMCFLRRPFLVTTRRRRVRRGCDIIQTVIWNMNPYLQDAHISQNAYCDWVKHRRTIWAIFREARLMAVHSFRPSQYLHERRQICRWRDSCEAHRSYADDVLKETTKPSTIPSTVSIWLEIPSDVLVISDTNVTTAHPTIY